MLRLGSVSANIYHNPFKSVSRSYIVHFFKSPNFTLTLHVCTFFARVSLPLGVGGFRQDRFVSQDKGGMYCCNCAARFYRFSLSVVGVMALATAPAVQLVGDGRRLAVPGGAVEAAPHTQFGSFHPRAVGVGF